MKKFLAIVILCLSLTSCKALWYGSWAAGASYVHQITDYSEKMNVLSSNFPEVYDLFRMGRITTPEVYEYMDKDGEEKYHIVYQRQ